jgi:hypothetical protein
MLQNIVILEANILISVFYFAKSFTVVDNFWQREININPIKM